MEKTCIELCPRAVENPVNFFNNVKLNGKNFNSEISDPNILYRRDAKTQRSAMFFSANYFAPSASLW